jgi:TRAP-type mannitol/chloroaromatic compound transport system substrate-binding protein
LQINNTVSLDEYRTKTENNTQIESELEQQIFTNKNPWKEIRKTYKQQCAVSSDDEEASDMDWMEKYIERLDKDNSEIKTEMRETRLEIRSIVDNALTEMRDRDNQRHKEFLAINDKMDKAIASQDGLNKWVIGFVVAAIISVVGIAISVICALPSLLNK